MLQVDPRKMETLIKKHSDCLQRTEKAIREQPDAYRRIKEMLADIQSRSVDVSEYYKTARKLTELVERLNRIDGDTLFGYFQTNLDPSQLGDVRYFRYICKDLAQQIGILDDYRASRCRLRVIK